jgi:hypothetical protein
MMTASVAVAALITGTGTAVPRSGPAEAYKNSAPGRPCLECIPVQSAPRGSCVGVSAAFSGRLEREIIHGPCRAFGMYIG